MTEITSSKWAKAMHTRANRCAGRDHGKSRAPFLKRLADTTSRIGIAKALETAKPSSDVEKNEHVLWISRCAAGTVDGLGKTGKGSQENAENTIESYDYILSRDINRENAKPMRRAVTR